MRIMVGSHSSSIRTSAIPLIVLACGVSCLRLQMVFGQTLSSTIPKMSQVRSAEGFPGVDACARIEAAIADAGGGGIIHAEGLRGSQACASNMLAGITGPALILFGDANLSVSVAQVAPAVEGIRLQGQWKRAGLSSGGTTWIWTGTAGGTMLDTSGTGDVLVEGIHFFGNNTASTGWKIGGGSSPSYWQHGRDLFFNGFYGSSGAGALFFGSGSHFVSDTDFYSVQVSDSYIGIQGIVQDGFFYNLDVQNTTTGMILFGNSSVALYGGHFGANTYDVALSDSSIRAGFNGVWFENSASGILQPPGRAITMYGPLNFIDCHLSTSKVGGYMLDTTNVTGAVNFIGNTIAPTFGGGSTTTIYLASTLTDSVRLGNTGVTWAGTNVPMLTGGPLQVSQAVSSGVNAVAFSATPTFDASLGNTQTITLAGNVTNSKLSNCKPGEWLVFDIIEDATGGRSFAWPSNVHGGGAITTMANYHNRQSFYCDSRGVAWAISAMQSGTWQIQGFIALPGSVPIPVEKGMAYSPGSH